MGDVLGERQQGCPLFQGDDIFQAENRIRLPNLQDQPLKELRREETEPVLKSIVADFDWPLPRIAFQFVPNDAGRNYHRWQLQTMLDLMDDERQCPGSFIGRDTQNGIGHAVQ